MHFPNSRRLAVRELCDLLKGEASNVTCPQNSCLHWGELRENSFQEVPNLRQIRSFAYLDRDVLNEVEAVGWLDRIPHAVDQQSPCDHPKPGQELSIRVATKLVPGAEGTQRSLLE